MQVDSIDEFWSHSWHSIVFLKAMLSCVVTLRVQVPNYHILSKIATYITTILNPSTQLLGPLDPWGLGSTV